MANNTGQKFGGRVPGSANVITKEMREILKGIISNELERIPDTLKKLTPEKRLDLVLKLMPYVLPKVESISMKSGEPMSIDWS